MKRREPRVVYFNMSKFKGKQKRPRDANELARLVVDIATGEKDDTPTPSEEQAREAGKAGGEARAEALSDEKKSEIARLAAQARWKKSN